MYMTRYNILTSVFIDISNKLHRHITSIICIHIYSYIYSYLFISIHIYSYLFIWISYVNRHFPRIFPVKSPFSHGQNGHLRGPPGPPPVAVAGDLMGRAAPGAPGAAAERSAAGGGVDRHGVTGWKIGKLVYIYSHIYIYNERCTYYCNTLMDIYIIYNR